ncbi:MAG: hypothetical protein OEY54_00100 [Nitrosopumilus sp.]|nr:hypothetical protein [Nitrosopumilus sp.]
MQGSFMLDSEFDLDWSEFSFFDWIPKVIRLQSVRDDDWQITHKSMLGTTLEFKFETLKNWLEQNNNSEKSQVQTQNYVQALRRSGLIE